MTVSEREQRLQFHGLTDRDMDLLKALRSLLEKHVAAIEDAFYDHLLAFPETAQLLRDCTTVERLKKLQRDYLLRITEGKYCDASFADRLRIGQTHERVGLSPRWQWSPQLCKDGAVWPRPPHSADGPHGGRSKRITRKSKTFICANFLPMTRNAANDSRWRMLDSTWITRRTE
jgi:hypothetical protein